MRIHILQSVPLCSQNIFLLLFWSRLVHADLAMHATVAALGTLPALCPCEPLRPVGDMQAVSYGARSRQYSPLLPGSRPPTRNLDLLSTDHAQGPCAGFIYSLHNHPSFLKTAQACIKDDLGRFAPSALPHYKHTLPCLDRSTPNELQQNQHEKRLR